MKKNFTTLFLCVFFTSAIYAQTIEWVNHFGDISEDVIKSVTTDADGNIYTTGYFAESSSFDDITLTAIGGFNTFVTKSDSDGNFLWAKVLAQPNDEIIDPYHSVISKSVAVDADGNVIIVGYFDSGDFDADPGIGEYILSATTYEMFIIKLDTDGDFMWASSFGSTVDTFESISDVDVDANGDIYVTGYFRDNISMFHAAGTSSITSYGESDIFVMKYAGAGYFLWMKNMGGTNADLGMNIDVTPTGDVFVTGQFNGLATFSPSFFGSDAVTLETLPNYKGTFALKLNASGDHQGVVNVGQAISESIGTAIITDDNNNTYVTGYYGGILSTNEGTPEEISIDSDTNYEAFVAKVNFTNQNVSWVKEIDGGTDSAFGFDLDVDSNQNVFLAGYYSETLSVGDFNLTKQTSYALESYLVTMNSTGEFLNAYQFGGINTADTQLVNIDANDNVIVAGSFRQTVDISPFDSENTELISHGFRDNYILSMGNSNVLSTDDYQLGNTIKLYPNPSENYIYIAHSQPSTLSNYVIFDVNGKSVLSGDLGINNEINISHLKSGFYFLSINQQTETFKFLKN
ncbi:T9SS type A sorting domain-containing protein [Winogradskyella psychrotolerans]|uniref:T9SS type A sorting domain-containing protein n=1 Tax=Winogradskyella psychrotolerans TaxID=1344585 RepID=UPI001C07616F|nr:T9SS type A sorting domain-containing protein [Winogradskyella psychrotolerans]MBU2928119.1 T9SS type A sorting domain-containing protein [Winogradskyella psychrotolerans]